MRAAVTGTICVLAALALSIRLAGAGPSECRDAVDEYKSAKSDVADAVRRYANCVSSSDGHDDCSVEFSTLRSAQDDFESAVANYESECR
jgi:hypothetical protein